MRRFLTPRWLFRHAAMLVLVATFLGLGWWQASRARAGNTLSIAYAFEWPLFAAFVIGLWIREIRLERRGAPPPPPAEKPVLRPVVVPVGRPEPDDADDPALREYNDYLAWLAANPNRRPSEYRAEHPHEPLRE